MGSFEDKHRSQVQLGNEKHYIGVKFPTVVNDRLSL